MVFKNIILISILTISITYAKSLKCEGEIYARLNNYVVKTKMFEKNHECLDEGNSIVFNKKINQRINLLGKVYGLKRFYIANIEILQIQTFAGAHTRIVYFFKIENDGKLSLIKNGDIGSDIGEPMAFYDYFSGILTVKKFFLKSEENCNYLMEEIFKYKDGQFIKINDSKIIKKCI